jgi:hypothetical protein
MIIDTIIDASINVTFPSVLLNRTEETTEAQPPREVQSGLTPFVKREDNRKEESSGRL